MHTVLSTWLLGAVTPSTTPPTTDAPATDAPPFSSPDGSTLMWVLAFTLILSGLGIVLARRLMQPNREEREDSSTFVRSWLAVALVSGLIIFGGASFMLADRDLRNLLMGGLLASEGSAVAYYFSSKDADRARSDILAASLGTSVVPDLVRSTIQQAKDVLSRTALTLSVSPAEAADDWVVTWQSLTAGSSVSKGSGIQVKAGQSVVVPDVVGKQVTDARITVLAAELKPETAKAVQDSWIVVGTQPEAGTRVAQGTTVTLNAANTVTIPTVEGYPIGDAYARLNDAGLKPVKPSGATDTWAATTTVPPAGAIVAVGTTVEMAGHDVVPVPNLANLSLGDARAALDAVGLRAMPVEGALDSWIVVACSPPVGTGVGVGTAVQLSAHEMVEVPAVVGMTIADAQAALANAGFTASVGDAVDTAGLVSSSSPSSGVLHPRGGQVTLTATA